MASPLPDGMPSSVVLVIGYASCLFGLFGIYVRVPAVGVLLCFQTLLHRNSLPVQTLAVAHAWTILAIVVIGGASTTNLLRRPPKLGATRCGGCRWTPTVIVYVTAAAVFVSAIEKVRSGWLTGYHISNLLAFPKDHLLRGWLARVRPTRRDAWGTLLQYGTLLTEAGLPLAIMVVRNPRWVAWAWAFFFSGIFVCLQVPPLFLTTYGAIAVLLDSGEFGRETPGSKQKATGFHPSRFA